MSKIKTILIEEKKALLSYMRYRSEVPALAISFRKKNAVDSTKYRTKGNQIYRERTHNEVIHEEVWKLYSKSIVFAPNNSEELALGYGNRSALLFHLKNFEECIKDCDKAVNATSSNLLKFKLLCRKAECLMLLNKISAKVVALEALQLLEGLVLENAVKINFVDKLNIILNATGKVKVKNKSGKENNYIDEFIKFPRSEEVPCASKSVAIKYHKKWGRHIVATQNIRPGEIIAVDDVYCKFYHGRGIYLFCANCGQYTWSSIPCENCIYNVYCSESCRSEAWSKYHQFECLIYPLLRLPDQEFNVFQAAIKLVLVAINEVGGISKMKEEIADIENCADLRVRGFTDGVFHSGKAKSFYSLSSKIVSLAENQRIIENVCAITYMLVRYTTFFESILRIPPSKMFSNEDVLFVAALLLRTHYLHPKNAIRLQYTHRTKEEFKYGYAYLTFTSLINHSCDPNTDFYVAKNNKVISYARCPIEKGSQLFISYIAYNFLSKPTEDRQDDLINFFDFTCNCLPCVEDWSSIAVPSLMEITDFTPLLRVELLELLIKLNSIYTIGADKKVAYSLKLMNNIVYCLNTMVNRITVHCEDYRYCLEILRKLVGDVIGSWYFEVPSECYLP